MQSATFFPHTLRSGKTLVLIAASVMLLASLGVWGRAWLVPTERMSVAAAELQPGVPAPTSAQASASNQQPQSGEVELITLRPGGFEPQEITRPAGQFLLVITKRGVTDEISLRLEREAGNRLREVHVAQGRRHYREVFNLHPGTYVLSEANHPEWTCRITITAR